MADMSVMMRGMALGFARHLAKKKEREQAQQDLLFKEGLEEKQIGFKYRLDQQGQQAQDEAALKREMIQRRLELLKNTPGATFGQADKYFTSGELPPGMADLPIQAPSTTNTLMRNQGELQRAMMSLPQKELQAVSDLSFKTGMPIEQAYAVYSAIRQVMGQSPQASPSAATSAPTSSDPFLSVLQGGFPGGEGSAPASQAPYSSSFLPTTPQAAQVTGAGLPPLNPKEQSRFVTEANKETGRMQRANDSLSLRRDILKETVRWHNLSHTDRMTIAKDRNLTSLHIAEMIDKDRDLSREQKGQQFKETMKLRWDTLSQQERIAAERIATQRYGIDMRAATSGGGSGLVGYDKKSGLSVSETATLKRWDKELTKIEKRLTELRAVGAEGMTDDERNELHNLVSRKSILQRDRETTYQTGRGRLMQGRSTVPFGSAPVSSDAPRFQWPVRGRNITSRYGASRSTGNHSGLDIDGVMGEAVNAAGDGTVSDVGHNAIDGNFVRVDHGNGYTTSYSHLSGASVTPGTRIRAGQQVGRMGNTGRVHPGRGGDGSHLHFGVRRNGQRIDPLPFLQGAVGGQATPRPGALPPAPADVPPPQRSRSRNQAEINRLMNDVFPSARQTPNRPSTPPSRRTQQRQSRIQANRNRLQGIL